MHVTSACRRVILCIAPAMVLLSPVSVEGAFEGVVEIWQPFVEPEMGSIVLYSVPYSVFGYLHNELSLIAAESRVWTERDRGKFENRNAAHLAGLEVRGNPKPDTNMGFWGDTLRVVLDARQIDMSKLIEPHSPDTLVVATIECIRASIQPFEGSPGNALRYLEISVEADVPRIVVFDLREPLKFRRHFGR